MQYHLDRSPPTTGKSNTCTHCRKEISGNRIYRDMQEKPYHRDCLALAQQTERMDTALRGTFNGH